VRAITDQRERAALYGCPHGTLCSELSKRDDDLEHAAAILMQLFIDWTEQQFRSMGRRDARDLAVAMIASYQGIMLLTNTFREPELLVREGRRLNRWIDSLAWATCRSDFRSWSTSDPAGRRASRTAVRPPARVGPCPRRRAGACPRGSAAHLGALLGEGDGGGAADATQRPSDQNYWLVTVCSDYSPDLADALARCRLDLALIRVQPGY
jgi:hypothetical protein